MHQEPDNPKVHSLDDYSATLPNAGMWGNGWYCPQPCLDCLTIEKDCLSLPTPTALSSLNSRPPGQNKLEVKLKQLGLIQTGEVANPELLEAMFGLPTGYSSPLESKKEIVLPVVEDKPSEILLPLSALLQPSGESSISIPSPNETREESPGCAVKAISLWQPWASLIPLGLKHYETRSWKTSYRGKLLICSTAANSKQHKQYLKICDELELPPWENFLHGKAIALCELTDCIPMTAVFIARQSQTEILCGDWQVGRYAWKLENIQPIAEPFVVKGKQGLFDISLENYEFSNEEQKGKGERENPELLTPNSQLPTPHSPPPTSKKSDRWYTPPLVVSPIIQVMGAIDLDPCADDGKHIPAAMHFTVADDGLNREWFGRVFMNPPYSIPGKWMKKLQTEYESGRVTEAIALVPAATDTKWLSPVLKSQVACFWTGRIKFLDVNYQPRLSARQAHCLVYWGDRPQRFKEVFEEYGLFYVPASLNTIFSDRHQVLGGHILPKISPSTTEPEDEQPLRETLLLNSDLSDRHQVLGGHILPKISPSTTEPDKKVNYHNSIDPQLTHRKYGEGSGNLSWGYANANSSKKKPIKQLYFEWEYGGVRGKTYVRSHLKEQVIEMNEAKIPVVEILELLKYNPKVKRILEFI
jgi:phage N-6-adenine-methyltransferase